MPLVSETIIKNRVSHKQADSQAGRPGLKLIPLLYRHSSESGRGPTESKQSQLHGGPQPFICLGNRSLENIIFSCLSLIGTAMICIHSYKVSEKPGKE